MADVAKAMGFSGFGYARSSEIFAEHIALTALNNSGKRKLDLAHWLEQDYDCMPPMRWGGAHPFADGKFQTPSGKACFVATPYVALPPQAFTLNTGRIRDQWHTMTRTGLVPRLFGHRTEPYIEINAEDAAQLEVGFADLVEISGPQGTSLARAVINDTVTASQVFMPMHWSSAFATDSLANAATANAVDQFSGQPALKSAAVTIKKFAAAWYGYGVSMLQDWPAADYCARRPLENGFAFECAGRTLPKDWGTFLYAALASGGELTSLQSKTTGIFRCVVTKQTRVVFMFFASLKPAEVSRSWLQEQLNSPSNPLSILAGRPQDEVSDDGPILCACMNVGIGRIAATIAADPAMALDDVCVFTKAGTGCGSCRIEIRKMLYEAAKPLQAAE